MPFNIVHLPDGTDVNIHKLRLWSHLLYKDKKKENEIERENCTTKLFQTFHLIT